ncbi:putative glutaconyl-CoA decarboxylase subunit gamma [Bacteroidales bacterium KA00251]|nr:putative glutaconyl-CoA decarboxylase subunit gamma [Bacteroidales bacterium KA00251]
MKKEFKYTIDGAEYKVSIKEVEGQEVKLEVNGTSYTAILPEEEKPQPKPIAKPVEKPASQPVAPKVVAGNGAGIKAPLPGVIIDVLVKEGDAVQRGQKVAVLEAMKMENAIESDRDGTVVAVKVKKGDSIMEGSDIVIIG